MKSKVVYGFVSWETNDKDRAVVAHHAPLATFGSQKPGSVYKATVVCAEPSQANEALTNTKDLFGKIALVERGKCAFPEKAKRVQAAGAIAMIVANNDTDLPHSAFIMGESNPGDAQEIYIPCVMLSLDKVLALLSSKHNCEATVELYDSKRAIEAEKKEREWANNNTISTISKSLEQLWWQPTRSSIVKQLTGRATKFGFVRWTTDANAFNVKFAPLAIGPRIPIGTSMKVISSKLVLADPPLADSAITNDVQGCIVLIRRGKCTFPEKLSRAQAAGASAVIIANSDEKDPSSAFVMSFDACDAKTLQSFPPAVMVSYNVATEIEKVEKMSLLCCTEETANVLLNGAECYSQNDLPPFTLTDSVDTLWKACRAGDESIVKDLIRDKEISLAERDPWGCNALHHACLSGNAEIVKLLLPNAELLNAVDLAGQSALHLASLTGNNQCVQAILAKSNADVVLLQNVGGQTPLHLACLEGKSDVVNSILSHCKASEVVWTRDLNLQTPLHYACRGGFADCATALIATGVTSMLSVIDKNGYSALDYICQAINASRGSTCAASRSMLVYERLLQAGADIITTSDDTLPFDIVINKATRREMEVIYLKEMFRRQQVQLQEITLTKKKVRDSVSAVVAESRKNSFLLRESKTDREELETKLMTQSVHIRQIQTQMKTMLQFLKSSNESTNSSPVLSLDEISIGTKGDYDTEAELAQEAALARDLGKKYARQKNYVVAMDFFRKSLELYALPGVSRLLSRVSTLQQEVEERQRQMEAERRRSESLEALMSRYREQLNQNGAPKSAVKSIEYEIRKLSALDDGSPEFLLARDYLEWLVALPWRHDESSFSSFGINMFQKLKTLEVERIDKKRNEAATVIQNAAREYLSVFILEREIAVIQIQSICRGYLVRKKPRCDVKSTQLLILSPRENTQDTVEEECGGTDGNNNNLMEKINEKPDYIVEPEGYAKIVDTFAPCKVQSGSVIHGVKLIQLPLMSSHLVEDDPKGKLYVLQLISAPACVIDLLDEEQYFVWSRWAIDGEASQSSMKGPYDFEGATREFEKIYYEKTRNAWGLDREAFIAAPSGFIPMVWTDTLSSSFTSHRKKEQSPEDDEVVLFCTNAIKSA